MGTTLREAIESSVAEHEEAAGQTQPEAPVASAETEPKADAAPADESKGAGRTAGRPRDEKGRLLPGKAQKDSAQQPETAAQPQVATAQTAATAAAEPPKQVKRPSTWKKDHWEAFDKLAAENPALAEYINQREGDYAKGVSTYKQEWERAKPLIDAVTPHLPLLQQYGIEPAQHVSALFNAHKQLALGSPQEKLQMFARLAQDYGVPLEGLFVKDQQGQVFFNQQLLQAAQASAQQARQQPQQQDPRALVREILTEEKAAQEAAAMAADQERYPHFEQVKATMVGLLQSGMAQDLASAYEAAIRLPQHSDLFEAMQQQQRQAEEKRKAEEARKAADRARANAVSPRSASNTGANGSDGVKGRRAALESAWDKHATGRV